ncbi:hypothetical protein KPL74_11090 [Bacillus sp. NP157]|nr:hypothetical protein KPL74_11090 [Bacillus sp. NP157]
MKRQRKGGIAKTSRAADPPTRQINTIIADLLKAVTGIPKAGAIRSNRDAMALLLWRALETVLGLHRMVVRSRTGKEPEFFLNVACWQAAGWPVAG